MASNKSPEKSTKKSNVIVCSGCRAPLSGKAEQMVCRDCNSNYDLLCANLNPSQFKCMEPKQKKNWICPGCCKKSKFDNSSTPVSPSIALLETPSISNVTMRKNKLSHQNPDVGESYVTESRLREILHQELTSTINASIKNLVASELISITEKINGFQESITFFNKIYEEMKTSLDEKSAVIAELKKDNDALKTTVSALTGRLNTVELHMRESNIEINGIPEHRSENLINTIVQLTNIVENPVSTEDILHVTRVAKLNPEGDRPRAVVAKLRTPRLRDTILAAVSKFNKRNPQDKLGSNHLGIGGARRSIYISEHLTPDNKLLHAEARKKGKELQYKFVWVRNGRVYVRKDENQQALLIKNLDSLKRMS